MQLALWFRCYWKPSAVNGQRQKCLCMYICRKPLGFSCFSPVPECACKSTTVDPFPSALLSSFACISFHNFNKPQPLCLDVFVHCAAALGKRHNGTCQHWEQDGGGWGAAGRRRREAFVRKECLLPLMPIILEELMLTQKSERRLYMWILMKRKGSQEPHKHVSMAEYFIQSFGFLFNANWWPFFYCKTWGKLPIYLVKGLILVLLGPDV